MSCDRQTKTESREHGPSSTPIARWPTLLEINARHWLHELSIELHRPATLDDIDEQRIESIAAFGFNWIWLLGVWQTGPAGRAVSAANAQWREAYRLILPDVADEDITGSPFAVQRYEVHSAFGGNAALSGLRDRLRRFGIRLMLDFVPNHTALDHPWVSQHPDYYVSGTEQELLAQPQNYRRLGNRIFAHGRDPNFPGWPDTLQLDYRNPAVRRAMIAELRKVAQQCDGVRCDMAMLLLPEVFSRTWGTVPGLTDTHSFDEPFWPEAIRAVRDNQPEFLFLAEVYWGLEWTLQQQGFDFTYDKTLYDRLRAGDAEAVQAHLHAEPEFQQHSARFLENHDEPPAAGVFPDPIHRAAALITYFIPGMRFFHEGQLTGRRLRGSVHLGRRAAEGLNPELGDFYRRLLKLLRRHRTRDREWRLLPCRAAWDENQSWRQFISFRWQATTEGTLLVVVNFGPTRGQCRVIDPLPTFTGGRPVYLLDVFAGTTYERDGDDLASAGLYVDLSEWGFHVLVCGRAA